MARKYSIIIPVYNRPDEVDELLDSLTLQTYRNFEVLLIEDGSVKTCDQIAEKYIHDLDIRYFFKKNEGQGFARNYGYQRATGDYYIVFDSDCIIPPHYLKTVDQYLNKKYLDAYGGPDKSHALFTAKQKAIDYSMTSVFTTGGTRGGKMRLGPYHPRSFNMGISPEVFQKTGGYIIPFKGEDIEFSIRIIRTGFNTGLIREAFVYHKRRSSWKQFFRQLHFFGTARINIARFFPDQLKPVHFFPGIFTLGLIFILLVLPFNAFLAFLLIPLYLVYSLLILIDSLIRSRNIKVAVLSVYAGFLQLIAYGLGFMQEGVLKLIRG